MKHSIRTRFTLIFTGIMALVLIVMYVINSQFLESYYMRQMVGTLQTAYNTLDTVVLQTEKAGRTLPEVMQDEFGQSGEDSTVVSIFRELNDNSNINVVMIDQNGTAIIATSREGNWLAQKLQFYIRNRQALLGDGTWEYEIQGDPFGDSNFPRQERPETIFQNADYCIQRSVDSRSNTAYLESWGYFTDGKTQFLMSMPVALIRDSVAITNRFLLMVGAVILALGGILVYLTTSAITRPINHLAKISERMTRLDFGIKYEGRETDEIGVLGRSMNTMSEQLEKTIAELKTANNELQKDIDEKNKIDEMRKDFIANVSHELKTPIALIQGYAEGLTEGLAEDPESRSYYCNVIADEAQKMNKMVKQLTSLNDLEIGNDKIEFAYFDVAELVGSILETQKLVIRDKEAKVTVTGLSSAPVWADEFKIEEVITNYFNNALNHLEGDRNIVIHLERLEEQKRIRISVYNDGEPIPQEDIPRIWDKFFKVDKARTRAYGGSGIGLSIVKAIVDSHGQECGVQNEEKGVTFWFTLDAAGQEA